jgi:Outer membrane efflux protein
MKNIVIIVILLTSGINSYSQDSLSYYLGIAVENNPEVLQKFSEYKASLQKVPQVGGLPDPEITAGVFLSPMELVAGKQVADIRLMQMFPWFGVLKNAKDEMSLMAKAKFELFQDAKIELLFDLQRSWNELNKIKQTIRVSEQNVALLESIERIAVVKIRAPDNANFRSGISSSSSQSSEKSISVGSPGMNKMGANPNVSQPSASMTANPMTAPSGGSALIDVYQIQIEIGDLKNNIELTKSQLTTASAQFNGYLNRPQTSAIDLPDSIVAIDFEPSSLSLSDTLFNRNPMVEMLQFEGQSLDARKQMVTKMGYPMVGIGLNYSLINKSTMALSPMNGKDMLMPMVTVTLPIYRKKYKAMRTEADFLKSANLQNYQATVNALQTEYFQALQAFQDARRRIKLYATQKELASKSFGITLKNFSSAGSTLSDVLRIRQQSTDYHLKEIEAVTDYNTSVAWLKKLSCVDIQ